MAEYVACMAVSGNDSVRLTEQCWHLCMEGRLDRASELMRADFVHDDRRRGLSNTLINRDDTLANNAVLVEMGFVPQPFETIATHGASLALCRVAFRDDADNELAAIQVLGLSDDGLRAFCISFDDGAVEVATEEFDRLRATA